ncbi:unnamed protein product [Staurois parvus]|uniref:Uncharacterized protein n=1 Tax=Staurois parvus TaxID=386267 RepID=A0ABN9DU57_9NEOB|nr:unnamed protein product [Staurois parvus]
MTLICSLLDCKLPGSGPPNLLVLNSLSKLLALYKSCIIIIIPALQYHLVTWQVL